MIGWEAFALIALVLFADFILGVVVEFLITAWRHRHDHTV